MHSIGMKVHYRMQEERRARRKLEGDHGDTDPEDTESEEESMYDMDNFRGLQLGSITPVVRHKVHSS